MTRRLLIAPLAGVLLAALLSAAGCGAFSRGEVDCERAADWRADDNVLTAGRADRLVSCETLIGKTEADVVARLGAVYQRQSGIDDEFSLTYQLKIEDSEPNPVSRLEVFFRDGHAYLAHTGRAST